MIRANFDAADIVEANVVCGFTQLPPSESQRTAATGGSGKKESGIGTMVAQGDGASRLMAWKFPKGFRFSYQSVPPQRLPVPSGHKPIPVFGQPPPPNRISSWNGPANGPLKEKAELSRPSGSMPDLREGYPLPKPVNAPPTKPLPLSDPPLISKHPKHARWDDTSRLDRPYDNPYYCRPVANHLWLPRDPVGLLDLDDTVNVFKSLTSDSSLGKLGEWVESGVGIADLPASPAQSDMLTVPGAPPMRRELSGTEEIALPPAIQDRVENIADEEDVDVAETGEEGSRQSSGRPRRPSNSSYRTSAFSMRRGRSTSIAQSLMVTEDSGQDAEYGPRVTTPSLLSANSIGRAGSSQMDPRPPSRRNTGLSALSATAVSGSGALPERSKTMVRESHPDLHAQARFARSRATLPAPASAMNVSFEPPTSRPAGPIALASRMRRRSVSVARSDAGLAMPGVGAGDAGGQAAHAHQAPVSTREAVMGEVIAEEVEATEERLREEEEEGRRTGERSLWARSWATAWLFSRRPPGESGETQEGAEE